MKPSARVSSAIEILENVFEGQRPADQIIADYFKQRRYAGSKDRREINTRVYNVLRARAKLSWLARACDISESARILVLLQAILADENVEELFDDSQYGPSALKGRELEILPMAAEFDVATAPDWDRLEYPEWMDQDFRTSLGDDFETVLKALNTEAPLDLRINRLHEQAANAQDILAAQNIEAQPTPHSPLGLRTTKKVKLGGIQAYKSGLVDIQDEGSQLIALLSKPKGAELVVDFCAGAGGKTLALAAEMENQGHLYALDISATRLYKMRPRLERAGIKNVILNQIKSEQDPWLKQFEARVDRVLIDAPCSGTGAWRRNPESRWKMDETLMADLLGRQGRILSSAAHLTKPGGLLIYATCSVLNRENEDQVSQFLAHHEQFSLLDIRDVWGETLSSPCPFEGPYMKMRPDVHHSDGFFCAVLKRHEP